MEPQPIGRSGSPDLVIPGQVGPLMPTHPVDVATPACARPPFDSLTITLHWVTLLIVLAQFGSGLLYARMEERSWALSLLDVHRSLGVTIWALTLFRLTWRVTGARFPAFPASMTPLHRLGARLSEYGLYALLLIQPASGLAQTILRGRTFEVFAWSIPPLVTRDVTLVGTFRSAHEIGAWCLFALAGLHAAAALVHHFFCATTFWTPWRPLFCAEAHADSAELVGERQLGQGATPAADRRLSAAGTLSSDLLNDNGSDHAWMDRTGKVIGTRFIELEGEALVRIHRTRTEQSCIADYRVRLIIHVGPDDG